MPASLALPERERRGGCSVFFLVPVERERERV